MNSESMQKVFGRENSLCSIALFLLKLLLPPLVLSIMIVGYIPSHTHAAVETPFLYHLSNFNGRIPYDWVQLSVDLQRNEVYVIDTREGDIRIFNEKGMEIYSFGDDHNLGPVFDLAVKEDGSLLVLSRKRVGSSIHHCNFRGEHIAEIQLKNVPVEFSPFLPDRIVYRDGLIYLLNKSGMRIIVTDANGLFRYGHNVKALVTPESDEKRKKFRDADIEGFSVDKDGNILLTIPTLFRAIQLSPEGQAIGGFGRPGSTPGGFGIVGGIVADDRGNYYVADRLRCVVMIYDKNFKFVKEFGFRGLREHNLVGPKDLAIDSQGRLYVSQLRRRGVSVFKISFN